MYKKSLLISVIFFSATLMSQANPGTLEKSLYKQTLNGYFGARIFASQGANNLTINFRSSLPFSSNKWSISKGIGANEVEVASGKADYTIDDKTGEFKLTLKGPKSEDILTLSKRPFKLDEFYNGVLFVKIEEASKLLISINNTIDNGIAKGLPVASFKPIQSQLKNNSYGKIVYVNQDFFNHFGGIEFLVLTKPNVKTEPLKGGNRNIEIGAPVPKP